MAINKRGFYSEIVEKIEQFNQDKTEFNNSQYLDKLVEYIREKQQKSEKIKLTFVCTHNSRRSQFAQLWAFVSARYYDIDIESYSGGVEVTACNKRTIDSIKRFGFKVENKTGGENPKYVVKFSDRIESLTLFSKLYDNDFNPSQGFAAIMTCSHVA